MRRADRLFRIVSMLRSGRLLTGAQLAVKLEISQRTLYRDIRDLQLSGMPILGEPGVGYTLRRDLDMPPLQFTPAEIASLVLGARMVGAWGGAAMATAANDALRKIEAAVPEAMRSELDTVRMYAPEFVLAPQIRARIDLLHLACAQHRTIECRYDRLDDVASERTLRPLALIFWGGVWTLLAWCELRDDFRTFRVDRMSKVALTAKVFVQQRGQTWTDYLRKTLPANQLRAMGLKPPRAAKA
jgi:predicted DNA-binding transcriptional regulator YafY